MPRVGLAELNAPEKTNPVHERQVLTYLRLTGSRFALLLPSVPLCLCVRPLSATVRTGLPVPDPLDALSRLLGP